MTAHVGSAWFTDWFVPQSYGAFQYDELFKLNRPLAWSAVGFVPALVLIGGRLLVGELRVLGTE